MENLKILLVLLLSIIFLQCSKNQVSTEEEVAPDLALAEKRLMESDGKLDLQLFRETIKQQKDKNVFISLSSVAMAS